MYVVNIDDCVTCSGLPCLVSVFLSEVVTVCWYQDTGDCRGSQSLSLDTPDTQDLTYHLSPFHLTHLTLRTSPIWKKNILPTMFVQLMRDSNTKNKFVICQRFV